MDVDHLAHYLLFVNELRAELLGLTFSLVMFLLDFLTTAKKSSLLCCRKEVKINRCSRSSFCSIDIFPFI